MATALVVPVPEAAPLVDAWRARTIPVVGLPPHVTLTYPFAHPSISLFSELEELASALEPFDYVLARCGRFPGVLYLDPEPADPFLALTSAVLERWPEWPRYGGEHPDWVEPHVTAAVAELDEAEAAIAPQLPIAARATEILLVDELVPRRWKALARFPLGGAWVP